MIQPTITFTISRRKASQKPINKQQHHHPSSSSSATLSKHNVRQKSRFDGLDVAAMTSHLKRTILGFKLANVYDGSALGVNSSASGGGNDKAARGVYMFKLADPSSPL